MSNRMKSCEEPHLNKKAAGIILSMVCAFFFFLFTFSIHATAALEKYCRMVFLTVFKTFKVKWNKVIMLQWLFTVHGVHINSGVAFNSKT